MNYLISAAQDLNQLGENLKGLISQAWPVIVGVLGAVVVVWGAFLGFKYWQAGSQEKQREAKEYLKNFFIGLAIIFVLGVVAVALIGWLGNWAGNITGINT